MTSVYGRIGSATMTSPERRPAAHLAGFDESDPAVQEVLREIRAKFAKMAAEMPPMSPAQTERMRQIFTANPQTVAAWRAATLESMQAALAADPDLSARVRREDPAGWAAITAGVWPD